MVHFQIILNSGILLSMKMGQTTSALPFLNPLFSIAYQRFAVIFLARVLTWLVLAISWSLVAIRFNALFGVLWGFQNEPFCFLKSHFTYSNCLIIELCFVYFVYIARSLSTQTT